MRGHGQKARGQVEFSIQQRKNLQKDVGAAKVEIEIVAYGSRVADAMKANVKVIACENTMRGQKLTRDDMLSAITYVPAGVTEIMTKQSEGWSYLRP